ncbi:DUF3592 domain-containing protein [Corallococcus silvisoli]|uniref:DUF3592 domain-containing protein n=1 Tax=Corallococcus silvisoli TaxID=2697031 RepID=UPI001377CF3F|nr:DUF3592 domain-containing protein [Corallococcus silvisoli]NBD09767.1 DUF3592 domain-containing protein [Corallococcus silvisoli]
MAVIAARALGASFVVLGVSMLVLTWGSYQRDTRIVREGVHAEGTVLKKERLAAADDTDYVLHYAFTPPDGTRREHQRHISQDLWKRLRPGDRIQVLYDANDPRRGFPEGHGVMSLGLALYFSFVLVGLVLIGAVALLARAETDPTQVASTSLAPPS